MRIFRTATMAEPCANDATGAKPHRGRSRASGYARGPRPGRLGVAKWAPVLAMAGAGVTFVLYIMTTMNASMADKLVAVTRSIEERDRRINVRFDEMDKRINGQLAAMDQRYDGRFAAMERRLERPEVRADRTDERLTRVEAQLTTMDTKLDRVLEHVSSRR